MIVQIKNLIGLPVVTRSGARLGRVTDCLIDSTSQSIIQYEVKGNWLSVDKLLIKRDQVVSLEADKIVVEDAVAPQKIAQATAAGPVATAPAAGSFTTIVQNDRP